MELLGICFVIGKVRVQAIAAIVVLVFAGGIWWSGGSLHAQWLRFYSAAVFVATAVLAAWDQFLWRFCPFQSITGVPRNLRGTWIGALTTEWKDPSTGVIPPPKPAYLVVRQTFTSVSVKLFTDESRSQSSLGRVWSADSQTTLDYMYLNRPDNSLEHRSRMHHGSTSLYVTGRPASRLKGHYWTDRDSKGELDFNRRSKKLAEDFESAQILFR
jgi:SMODS-associating 2TM, beta-strand rich effector domain